MRILIFGYNLGCVYNVIDRLDDAAIAFRRATELNPSNADAWANLGVVLSSVGDIQQAEEVLRRSIKMNPEHYVGWLNLISLLYREGRIEEAEETHRQASEIIPEFDNYTDDLHEFIENASEDTELNSEK